MISLKNLVYVQLRRTMMLLTDSRVQYDTDDGLLDILRVRYIINLTYTRQTYVMFAGFLGLILVFFGYFLFQN